jgi:hypothetical protein
VYEDDSLLGYSAVQSHRSRPTFQRCVLLLSLGLWSGPDNGCSIHSWNFGLLQQDYTALYPRKLSSSCCFLCYSDLTVSIA